jgi:exopolyphosphatase/pppGpp-phosphohydrolase
VRVASVDLGTNSTRLLVADVEDGRLDDVVRRLKITRLGEGVDERKRLLPAPIARVRNVLTDFRREAEQLGAERTLAVATSAVRDAENGEAFLGEVEWSYGFKTRLLSGEEEAELTFRGASTGRDVAQNTLVIDIGGGSTELVVGGTEGLSFHDSLNMGGVRLTERFLHSDPPTNESSTPAARRHMNCSHRASLETCGPKPQSASPEPSPRSPPSTSGSPSTTPTRCRATTFRAKASARSSSASRRCRSRNAGRCRHSIPTGPP